MHAEYIVTAINFPCSITLAVPIFLNSGYPNKHYNLKTSHKFNQFPDIISRIQRRHFSCLKFVMFCGNPIEIPSIVICFVDITYYTYLWVQRFGRIHIKKQTISLHLLLQFKQGYKVLKRHKTGIKSIRPPQNMN